MLLTLALLCSGCTVKPAQPEPSTEPSQTENRENNLNQMTHQAAQEFGLAYVEKYGFNPFSCVCITNRPVFSLVYESLFVLNSRFQPEPVLCETFSVSDNGQSYLITLCDGIRFSDGSALSARDVVSSLEAARDSDYYGSRFSRVAEFCAKNERTVQITLTQAYENLPLLLDVPIVKAGTETAERPLGSGPYAFAQEGNTLSLQRIQDWWQDKHAPVEFDRIQLTEAKDPTAVRDSFEFGSTSLVCADLTAPNAVGYRCDYELWDCPTTAMQYLGFNLNTGIFYQRGLRAAVTHIVDREALISEVYKGFGTAAYLPCPASSPLYDQELAMNYGYNAGAFSAALLSANVPKDYVGTLLVCSADPSRMDLAQRIAKAMTNAGLRMNVKALDEESYTNALFAGNYDMFIGEVRLSGNFDLTEFFRADGSLCKGGIQNNGMEQLCRAALENSGNCYDLYRGVMDNGYFCPLLFKSYAVMANRGVIGS
ncbi:MAG: ABC transporter substrate-binding protein, partial [Oscillospiraceae bacterium]|nr:ABC transporter substrate-binding protein [Oscillospiraceae bacterium]